MSVNKGNLFSILYMQVYRLTAGGIGVGTMNPNALTPGATGHAYRVVGVISNTLPAPTYELATFQGDQKILGQADLGVTDFGSFEIQLAGIDATLETLLAGHNVDTTTITSATISSPNTAVGSVNQVGIILTGQIQSRDTATQGTNQYYTLIFPRCEVRVSRPGLSQSGGINPNPVTLNVVPTLGGHFPGGNAFSATQAWDDNKSLFYSIVANAPYSFTAFVQDSSDTTYVLGYRPTTNTTNQTDHIWTVNGAITAPSSVDTTTGVVTLAAAGTSGHIATGLYKTNFVAI